MFTDTIYFMSRLPTYTIKWFKSALKKWLAADLVLSLKEPSEAVQGIGIVYSQAVGIC
jgi:50S ribosomal subunit-associated GTPase HflX